MKSVYDLALIVVDQCAQMFAARDRQFRREPPLLGIFSNVIINVVGPLVMFILIPINTIRQTSKTSPTGISGT